MRSIHIGKYFFLQNINKCFYFFTDGDEYQKTALFWQSGDAEVSTLTDIKFPDGDYSDQATDFYEVTLKQALALGMPIEMASPRDIVRLRYG